MPNVIVGVQILAASQPFPQESIQSANASFPNDISQSQLVEEILGSPYVQTFVPVPLDASVSELPGTAGKLAITAYTPNSTRSSSRGNASHHSRSQFSKTRCMLAGDAG